MFRRDSHSRGLAAEIRARYEKYLTDEAAAQGRGQGEEALAALWEEMIHDVVGKLELKRGLSEDEKA